MNIQELMMELRNTTTNTLSKAIIDNTLNDSSRKKQEEPDYQAGYSKKDIAKLKTLVNIFFDNLDETPSLMEDPLSYFSKLWNSFSLSVETDKPLPNQFKKLRHLMLSVTPPILTSDWGKLSENKTSIYKIYLELARLYNQHSSDPIYLYEGKQEQEILFNGQIEKIPVIGLSLKSIKTPNNLDWSIKNQMLLAKKDNIENNLRECTLDALLLDFYGQDYTEHCIDLLTEAEMDKTFVAIYSALLYSNDDEILEDTLKAASPNAENCRRLKDALVHETPIKNKKQFINLIDSSYENLDDIRNTETNSHYLQASLNAFFKTCRAFFREKYAGDLKEIFDEKTLALLTALYFAKEVPYSIYATLNLLRRLLLQNLYHLGTALMETLQTILAIYQSTEHVGNEQPLEDFLSFTFFEESDSSLFTISEALTISDFILTRKSEPDCKKTLGVIKESLDTEDENPSLKLLQIPENIKKTLISYDYPSALTLLKTIKTDLENLIEEDNTGQFEMTKTEIEKIQCKYSNTLEQSQNVLISELPEVIDVISPYESAFENQADHRFNTMQFGYGINVNKDSVVMLMKNLREAKGLPPEFFVHYATMGGELFDYQKSLFMNQQDLPEIETILENFDIHNKISENESQKDAIITLMKRQLTLQRESFQGFQEIDKKKFESFFIKLMRFKNRTHDEDQTIEALLNDFPFNQEERLEMAETIQRFIEETQEIEGSIRIFTNKVNELLTEKLRAKKETSTEDNFKHIKKIFIENIKSLESEDIKPFLNSLDEAEKRMLHEEIPLKITDNAQGHQMKLIKLHITTDEKQFERPPYAINIKPGKGYDMIDAFKWANPIFDYLVDSQIFSNNPIPEKLQKHQKHHDEQVRISRISRKLDYGGFQVIQCDF